MFSAQRLRREQQQSHALCQLSADRDPKPPARNRPFSATFKLIIGQAPRRFAALSALRAIPCPFSLARPAIAQWA